MRSRIVHKFIIASACTSLLLSAIAIVYNGNGLPPDWLLVLLVLTLIATLAVFSLFFSQRLAMAFNQWAMTAKVALRTVLLAVTILLFFLQFFFFARWMHFIVDGPKAPADLHLVFSFYSVGFWYTVALLYKLTALRQ